MNTSITFNGFEPANTTAVPDAFFDELLPLLNGAELKAMLYIIRRTLGFKKTTDTISFNQFLHGITTKNDKVLDKGCGVKDRTTLSKALARLEALNCITTTKSKNDKKENEVTAYSIKFRSQGVVGKSYHPSRENRLPLVGKTDYRSREIPQGVVGKSYPQETVIQETVIQETVIQETERESDAPTDTQPAPLSDIAIAHPTPLPVSVFADDENAHDEADRAVIAHMLSQQGNPDSVFYMPPAPLDAPTAPQADIAAPQEDNAVTVTTEPLGDNPIATAPASITTKKNKRATSEPKEPKITQAQIDRVFETMNEALRSSAVYGQPDFSLVPSRKATEEVKQLIKAKALPSVLKAVILDMWNEFKNGEFWWRLPGRMTVPAICGQYSSRAPSLMPKVKLVAVEPDVPTAERIVDVSQYVTPLMKKMRATKAAFEARQLALQQRKG